MDENSIVEMSSGNVFEDLGLPNAEELQLQAYLAMEIRIAVKTKRFTRQQAAQRLGISKEEVNALLEVTPFDYSVGQLVQYLNRLDRDVKLSAFVSPRAPEAKKQAQKRTRDVVAAR